MSHTLKTGIASCVLLLSSIAGSDEVTADAAEQSIMQIMVATITPASDILWGADNPTTDESWETLDKAAVTLIAAFEETRLGGAGPNDAAWAAQAKFQTYIEADIAAANAARAAIAERDLDALYLANDALYTPCESCHVDFNPGVNDAEN